MMLDKRNLCSDEQSLVLAVGTHKCTRSIPRGSTSTDAFGNTLTGDAGKSLIPIFAQIVTAVDSAGGAATLKLQLVSADEETLTTNQVIHQSTEAIAEAELIAGYDFAFSHLPKGVTKAYWGFQLVVAGEDITVGKLSAGVCAAKQTAPGM